MLDGRGRRQCGSFARQECKQASRRSRKVGKQNNSQVNRAKRRKGNVEMGKLKRQTDWRIDRIGGWSDRQTGSLTNE